MWAFLTLCCEEGNVVLSAGACGVQERALAPLELALTAEPPYVSAANCALITPEPAPP